MTIEVKIAKNGRINAKVNGKCVAINTLSELVGKSLRNNEQVELIASDGHKFTCTGYELYEFAHPLCRRDSFNFMDDAGNTFPAYTMTDAIYTVDKFASGEYKTRNIFAEYAVSAMAQDIATEAEIENAQAVDVKEETKMTNINSNVTIDDNGKIFDSAKVTIDQAVNIISRLNYRNDTFQYRFTTREDHADIKYRHFDAYRQNGDKDAFAISEIVINGKLEIVRFFNLFRDIIVDLHIGNLNCKLGYKGAIELVDEPEAEVVEPVNPERFSATVYYYRPDENGGEPWRGDKYQQFATAADAANFIINFAAEHYDYTITTDSNIRDWDNRKQYWLTDADINALAADAFVKTTRQADALKDKISRDAKASDVSNVFALLPDVDDLNDIESEWQYWQGIYAQINREQGNFTAQIGVATVIFRDWLIVEICESVYQYKVVNGKRQYRISGRLVSRKEFEEFVLIGTDDKHEPPTPPTGIYDELLNTPVTDKSERIEALADAINENRDAWHEADFLLTVAERNGDTLRAAELKTFMDGCIADAYQLNNALDNLIKPHTPPTVESDTVIFAKNVAEYFVGHDFHFDFAEIVNGRLKHHFADYRYGDRFIETYTDATPSKLLYATEIIPLAYGSCNYVLNDFTTLTRNAFGSLASVEAAERDIEDKNPIIEPAAYTPQVAEWIDPHQYGEPGNLEQPRDISVYCNGNDDDQPEPPTPPTVDKSSRGRELAHKLTDELNAAYAPRLHESPITPVNADGKKLHPAARWNIAYDTLNDTFGIWSECGWHESGFSLGHEFCGWFIAADLIKVTNRLRVAIERRDKEFTFNQHTPEPPTPPTVGELNQPAQPTFEQGKAYYQHDWTARAAATDTKPYYIIKRTAKSVFVDTNRDSCDPFRYTIRKNDKGEYFKTYDGHAVYASYNA